ncbi:uncharacterized protein DS421_7g218190 [Arachis hypogaea]|nr:uncharacterized protein DS421_7g218190 [Arachis hypogaea]
MFDKDQLGALGYDRYVTNDPFHHNGSIYPQLIYFAHYFFLYPTSSEILSYEYSSSSFHNFSCYQNLATYLFWSNDLPHLLQEMGRHQLGVLHDFLRVTHCCA